MTMRTARFELDASTRVQSLGWGEGEAQVSLPAVVTAQAAE